MHHFHAFKGFRDTGIDLFKPLTVLIGPNGSGKTNAIEGVELLSALARGVPIHNITDLGKGGSLEIRGGLQSCPPHGNDYFRLGCSKAILFQYEVAVDPQRPMISEERFDVGDTNLFNTIAPIPENISSDIRVSYNNFARGGKKPQVSVSANISVLSQYKQFAANVKGGSTNRKWLDFASNYLRASFVFDPQPKLMRGYERMGNHILTKDGANISAVLYNLQMGTANQKETLSRILGWIKQLPEEPYNQFDFVTTALNDVIFGFIEKEDAPVIDARLLSDGTLRCLAVLTALETADPSSLVIIEEFDNGLHPSRVKIICEAIKDCCTRRKINVLITTHNPATLNALDMDQLGGVVLCAKNKASGYHKLIPLFDLPRFDEILERGRLGDLVTKRIVDQYLVPGYEEARQTRALEWLKSLP